MFWGAGRYTVFDDEAFSCHRYVMPVGEMVAALWNGVEPDPPLYYVLINGWVRVFGVGPLGLRSLSILFFLAGLVFIRLAGQAWFDRRTGLIAMLLCALHPAHLFFGFAARWYSLMFLLVAVLLWLTARLSAVDPGRRGRMVAWGLAAASVCYSNYFGPAVVGLMWLVGMILGSRRRHGIRPWIGGGMIALALFSPWTVPFILQAGRFGELGSSWGTCVATAARTSLALTTGNLASVDAWWAWGPAGLFAVGLMILLVLHWRVAWPITVVTLGCFAAGVVSRTMIDKYVMTFSGPACLLAAALWNCQWRIANSERRAAARRMIRHGIALMALACLIVGWVGCGVNVVTQRYWSSLRWLDPFEDVMTRARAEARREGAAVIVMSHPAARYYLARAVANDKTRRAVPPNNRTSWWKRERTVLADWRSAVECQEDGTGPQAGPGGMTPAAVLGLVDRQAAPRVIMTVQTAGFVALPDWESLQSALDERYVLTNEQRHLEDPAAAWKDRLDPNVRHPRWRIVVRRWELRNLGVFEK